MRAGFEQVLHRPIETAAQTGQIKYHFTSPVIKLISYLGPVIPASELSDRQLRFLMSQAEQYRHNGQDERTDHARFGTHRSSRQPL